MSQEANYRNEVKIAHASLYCEIQVQGKALVGWDNGSWGVGVLKMPHAHSSSAASSGGDDLGSTDEVKVFKDEGDGEDEKRSSENLLEEKSSLIDWTESEVRKHI
ncbi:jg20624 [Pararge aegeria aegeria]|uniref:Jg20624 protein n=1 Tax=Pararge aegeria aegeria TaxID=348720 RepID=A0A8S4R8Q7_9NEOP|nr:jg20624 [Pararge aegeria aegeria]